MEEQSTFQIKIKTHWAIALQMQTDPFYLPLLFRMKGNMDASGLFNNDPIYLLHCPLSLTEAQSLVELKRRWNVEIA